MNTTQSNPTDSDSMPVTLSSEEIVTKLHSLDLEQSIKIRMKCGDLTSAWENATAVKKDVFLSASVMKILRSLLPYRLTTKKLRYCPQIYGKWGGIL